MSWSCVLRRPWHVQQHDNQQNNKIDSIVVLLDVVIVETRLVIVEAEAVRVERIVGLAVVAVAGMADPILVIRENK